MGNNSSLEMRNVFILMFYEGYFFMSLLWTSSSPLANRLEKSVSVRRKRASLSLLLHASMFFWPASRDFSSRLLFFCRNPKVLHELSPKSSIPNPKTGNYGTAIKPKDARLLWGLDVDLRLCNWPVLMRILMNCPRRALLPSFNQITHARTREREAPPSATMCGKVHAPP